MLRGLSGSVEATRQSPIASTTAAQSPTPECTEPCYHYHVQDRAPFTFGCYGPAESSDGKEKLVEGYRNLDAKISFSAKIPAYHR